MNLASGGIFRRHAQWRAAAERFRPAALALRSSMNVWTLSGVGAPGLGGSCHFYFKLYRQVLGRIACGIVTRLVAEPAAKHVLSRNDVVQGADLDCEVEFAGVDAELFVRRKRKAHFFACRVADFSHDDVSWRVQLEHGGNEEFRFGSIGIDVKTWGDPEAKVGLGGLAAGDVGETGGKHGHGGAFGSHQIVLRYAEGAQEENARRDVHHSTHNRNVKYFEKGSPRLLMSLYGLARCMLGGHILPDGTGASAGASLRQSGLDLVLDLAAAAQSEDTIDDFAVPVDKERRRQELDTTVSVADGFLADQNGIVHAHLFCELRNVLFTGVIHRDTENLESIWAVLFLHFFEPGHFDFAGLAPGRPEV